MSDPGDGILVVDPPPPCEADVRRILGCALLGEWGGGAVTRAETLVWRSARQLGLAAFADGGAPRALFRPEDLDLAVARVMEHLCVVDVVES